ncbi:uncharacterized protein TA11725 [Theileria annulata]|uniref:tRNA(Phe) 7-[(3-amino-3-carboxypropyl)-4-demethylwyosine(37)-N(4)]-methyltransferase n=1 Tax=Theileria annulata TaxID=5874 RepID=Q4UDM8_THEAN|nr:uncharacterized protein TA11725 [Theileria annulata]CAI74811.1 hypothetical protein, conserved [Theileria annulata]|eukprot:XP_952543.1 hypothetical protein, conserved [Theileria annulata]
MCDSRIVPEIFKDELESIYEGTEKYLLKNLNELGKITNKSKKVNEINDYLSNKLYENVQNVAKKRGWNQLKPRCGDSSNNLMEYINSYGYETGNTSKFDKSLKKSIDFLLVPLMKLIVNSGRYVTTSSCSGRIVFFEKDNNFQNKKNAIYGRSGRILYSSHTHVSDSSLTKITESIESNPKNKSTCYKLEEDLEEEETKDDSGPASTEDNQVEIENEVLLKFEPFLIHVDCNTLEDALRLLNICKSVGLKQSGLCSSGKKYILAIRGNNILETPIMIKSYKIENNKPILLKNQYLISNDYLIHLMNTCNIKMGQNFSQFLSLYHKLLIDFETNGVILPKPVQPIENDNVFKNLPKISDKNNRYIDMIRSTELVQRETMGFGYEGEKKVNIMSFYGECNQLARTHCCMASSKNYVVVYGGYEKPKSKTICVCDLNEIERGFKVIDINEHGPKALLDSTLISDGTVFITFGGRISGDKASNDVYMLYVYNFNGNIETNWYKCKVEGENIPTPRFRHSMCLEKVNKRLNDDEGCDNSNSTFRFFMSGGASSCSPLDDNILGDIWRSTVNYKIHKNDILNPTVKWDFLFKSEYLGLFSGSLAHSASENCLYFIGGCENLDEILNPEFKRMDHLIKFNLDNRTIDHKSLLCKNYENEEYPLNRMSHCCVPLENDDYFLVGGFGGLAFMDEICYLNTTEGMLQKVMSIPKGTRARMGSTVISFKYGNCNHKELWIIGGGVPAMLNYGSFYDKPLRIVMSCEGLCEEDPKNVARNKDTNFETNKYKILGLYVVVEDKILVKSLKNKLELLKIFDKNRKIFQFNDSGNYLYHSIACENVEDFTKCSKCSNKNLCISCNICSKCCYSTYDSVFFLPVKNITNHADIKFLSKYKVYSCPDSQTRIKKPKDKLLSIFKDKGLENSVKNVEVLGSNLLITPLDGSDFPEIDWEQVSREFKVSSVSLVGEIEGEERRRQVKILYGNGDVSIRENGVTYIFNIKSNMFSKGNSAERIRIQKMYFAEYKDHRKVNRFHCTSEYRVLSSYIEFDGCLEPIRPVKDNELKDSSKYELGGEIIVDFFCGIGYFTIPILKFTDEKIVSRVLCVDVNPTAIEYLEENAKANQIDLSRIEVRVDNCQNFGKTYGFEYIDKADKILLGLLPSSRVGWIPAMAALNKKYGGILYIHGLSRKKKGDIIESITTSQSWEDVGEPFYTTKQYEEDKLHDSNCELFSMYVLRSFHELCKKHTGLSHIDWRLHLLHVETVKQYSPHKYHQVVDLKITPIF